MRVRMSREQLLSLLSDAVTTYAHDVPLSLELVQDWVQARYDADIADVESVDGTQCTEILLEALQYMMSNILVSPTDVVDPHSMSHAPLAGAVAYHTVQTSRNHFRLTLANGLTFQVSVKALHK